MADRQLPCPCKCGDSHFDGHCASPSCPWVTCLTCHIVIAITDGVLNRNQWFVKDGYR